MERNTRHGMRLPKMHSNISQWENNIANMYSLQSAFSDLLNTTQQVRLCVTHYQCLCWQISVCADRSCLCRQISVCANRSMSVLTDQSTVLVAVQCRNTGKAAILDIAQMLSRFQHIWTTSEFGVTLSPSDTLGKSCYDMHLAIVQHLEKNDSTRDLESDLMLWNSTVYDEHTTELTKQYCSQ